MKKIKQFCLRMAEAMGKPRFSILGGVLTVLVIFASLLWVTIKWDTFVPLAIFLVLVILLAIPAVIGAFIRDKQR